MRRFYPLCLVIGILIICGTLKAQWSLTIVQPPISETLDLEAGSDGNLVGAIGTRATIWSSQGMVTDLHPSGAYTFSYIGAIFGNQQGGGVGTPTGLFSMAALWSGTAGSFVNLNPSGYSGFRGSVVRAMNASKQGGSATVAGPGVGITHAGIWSGTAGSFVDLHPPLYTGGSEILAMSDTQQGGLGRLSNGARRALLWSGSSGSALELHVGNKLNSLGFVESYTDSGINAMTATQQGGEQFNISFKVQAALWTGTKESLVMLHPVTANTSRVFAMAGEFQAGQVNDQAAVWKGTAESYFNLHSLVVAALGTGFTVSSARGAYLHNGAIVIVGTASNPTLGLRAAVTWRASVIALRAARNYDFNGDDQPDILWQNPATGQRGIWRMTGTTVGDYIALEQVGPPWQIAGAADFNADGKPDIIWQNPTTGQRGIWIMNGTSVSSYLALEPVGPPWQIAGAADFNGDGSPDIIWQNLNTGQRGIWIMSGTTVSSYVAFEPVGAPWEIAGSADFNHDGKPDIIWQNPVTGQRGIWIMNGTTVSTYAALEPVGPPWKIAGAADFNGDGDPDILWQNPATGQCGIWIMSGTAVSTYFALDPVGPPWQMRL